MLKGPDQYTVHTYLRLALQVRFTPVILGV